MIIDISIALFCYFIIIIIFILHVNNLIIILQN